MGLTPEFLLDRLEELRTARRAERINGIVPFVLKAAQLLQPA